MMTWIICYDIENDRLRQKLARYLEKKGWERLQKSLFAISMTIKEFNRHYRQLTSLFEARLQTNDKIYTWKMSHTQFAEGRVMGAGYDARWIQKEYVVYYIGSEDLLK